MPISVKCTCGKAFKLKDELGGKKVRCAACKAIIAVPKPAEDAEDEPAELVLIEDDPPEPKKSSPRARDESIRSESPRAPVPARSFEFESDDEPPSRRKRRQVVEEDDEDDYEERPRRRRKKKSSGFAVSPLIFTGLLMMAGAVVWFCGGLAFDVIFFYPPVLFVIGIVTTVKGFMGKTE